jgi:hypothetical protein
VRRRHHRTNGHDATRRTAGHDRYLLDPCSRSTVSAILNGKTYRFDDMFVTVPSGTREINGTFTGQGVTTSFGGFADGGRVILNSVKNLSGPSPVVDKCSVTHSNAGGGTSSFRLRFNIETAFGHHC